MNMQQILKQAQQMQKKLQAEQAIIESKEFEGTAGNNAVKVIIMGTGIVKSININDELINKEEKDVLEDLLIVAFNDARKKIDSETSSAMNNATGGINFNNTKLPF